MGWPRETIIRISNTNNECFQDNKKLCTRGQETNALLCIHIFPNTVRNRNVRHCIQETNKKKVQTKQNSAIKVLHNKNFYTPTTQLHKELRYPLVKDIEKINVCKFVHKQSNYKTPKIFNDLFTENKDIHKYNTRQSQNLATPLAATNFSQKTIDFRGPRTWNSIPMKIRKLECNKHFGKKLRAHLIDKLT